uniref:Uncharacterized protein n=1 Tax=Anopheles atroparvus TaxID=41427 RepID=A0A182IWI5_ANOAO
MLVEGLLRMVAVAVVVVISLVAVRGRLGAVSAWQWRLVLLLLLGGGFEDDPALPYFDVARRGGSDGGGGRLGAHRCYCCIDGQKCIFGVGDGSTAKGTDARFGRHYTGFDALVWPPTECP